MVPPNSFPLACCIISCHSLTATTTATTTALTVASDNPQNVAITITVTTGCAISMLPHCFHWLTVSGFKVFFLSLAHCICCQHSWHYVCQFLHFKRYCCCCIALKQHCYFGCCHYHPLPLVNLLEFSSCHQRLLTFTICMAVDSNCQCPTFMVLAAGQDVRHRLHRPTM